MLCFFSLSLTPVLISGVRVKREIAPDIASETPIAPVYIDGERKVTLKGDNMAAEFLAIVEDYVKTNYGEGGSKRNQNRIIPIRTI